MRLRLALISIAVATLALSACVLRPRYNELVEAGMRADDHVTVVFKDRATGQPIPDMPISISDGRERMNVKTDANGEASIPIKAAFTQANPLVVVDLPRSVRRYEFGAPGGPMTRAGKSGTEIPSTPTGTDVAQPLPPAPLAAPDGGIGSDVVIPPTPPSAPTVGGVDAGI